MTLRFGGLDPMDLRLKVEDVGGHGTTYFRNIYVYSFLRSTRILYDDHMKGSTAVSGWSVSAVF